MDIIQMTPRRPYIFRAFYEWILDNDLTPYVVVDTTIDGVMVPQEFIQNNQIILNVAPQSVGQYSASNDKIEFNARFGGVPQHIVVPMAAIEAIYARENNVGISFEDEPQYAEPQQSRKPEPKPVNPFHIVK
ncbi:ClpXP protease specificity-enhancing factor [Orbaceae bacterium ESL0727]|nr:ClpXP protease specificity-enhancing factor [Orbaceae bacterium ESL0727]